MKIIELEKVATIIAGQSPPGKYYNQDGKGVPFFQGKADFGERHPNIRFWTEKVTKLSNPGDILFSVRAPVGPININNIDACIGRGLAAIRVRQNIDLEYLKHYLQYIEPRIADLGTGSTFNAITIKTLKSIKIPLPPLPIQQKIAAILDAADAYRQKTKALIEKYDQLAQSLFLEMFGDPVRNEKGWEVEYLGKICIKITDGTHNSPQSQNNGIPYVTAKHVKEYGLDFDANPSYISAEDHDEIFKRCNAEFGDILYIKDGATTGIACINIFKREISLLSSLALLKLRTDKLANHYLIHWLNHPGVKAKLNNQFMSGAAIKRYTLKKIKTFQIPIPPLNLQTNFSRQIEMINDQKEKLKLASNKAEELFQSLLQRTFKGELVS